MIKLNRWRTFFHIFAFSLSVIIIIELLVRLFLYVSLTSYCNKYVSHPYSDKLRDTLTNMSLYKFDPVCYFLPRNGLFRGAEGYVNYPQAKERGEIRIMCVGDSTAYDICVQYDKCWPYLLQTLLREKYPDKNITVLNAGYPGFSSRQIKRIFQHQLVRYNPDIVIFKVAFEKLTDRYKLPMTSNKILNFVRNCLLYCLHESRTFRVFSVIAKPKHCPLVEKIDDFMTYNFLQINKDSENLEQKFYSDWAIARKIAMENGVRHAAILDEILINGNNITTNYQNYEKIGIGHVLRTYGAFKNKLETVNIRDIFVDDCGHTTEIGSNIIAQEVFNFLVIEGWIDSLSS